MWFNTLASGDCYAALGMIVHPVHRKTGPDILRGRSLGIERSLAWIEQLSVVRSQLSVVRSQFSVWGRLGPAPLNLSH